MADSMVEDLPVPFGSVAVRTPIDLADIEAYRRELTAYCYRMLGSGFEAEDAVQETMVRAWRNRERFEGRSSLRSWLYRIATNVCIDMSRQVQRRARPVDMGPASPPEESFLGPMLTDAAWVTPLPDAGGDAGDLGSGRGRPVPGVGPAGVRHRPAASARPSAGHAHPVRGAALAGRRGRGVARHQGGAINSSLQRARATLGGLGGQAPPDQLDAEDKVLLDQYVDAFERYDIDRLVTLLHDDAFQSMPPFAMWIKGAADIGRFMLEPGPERLPRLVLRPTSANGCPAFGQYKPDPDGGYTAWAIQVLEISGGKVSGMNFFLDFLDPVRLFPSFGLPLHLDG